MHQQYAPVRRGCSINARHHHAAQEKAGHIALPGRVRNQQRPNNPGRQKPVVQPLVGRQYFGGRKQLGPQRAEGFGPERGPGRHPQPQNVAVNKGREGNEELSEQVHGGEEKRQKRRLTYFFTVDTGSQGSGGEVRRAKGY